MQVSSNALFHFTSSFNQLNDILKDKFKLTYCHEEYTLNHELYDSYYPMVSFCDIPLSIAQNQIKAYGSYAIGLTKEWATANKLNPVVYIEKDSFLAVDLRAKVNNLFNAVRSLEGETLRNAATGIAMVKKIIDDALLNHRESNSGVTKIITPQQQKQLEQFLDDVLKRNDGYRTLSKTLRNAAYNLFNVFRYIKNYEGPHPKKTSIKSYRFYDEREWRYVPEFNDTRLKPSLNMEEFKKYRGIGSKPFINGVTLPFSSKDIKYLLVKSETEIPKLIRNIKKSESLTKSPDDADILTTRIMTVNQLFSDF
jgi:hypothetical protein